MDKEILSCTWQQKVYYPNKTSDLQPGRFMQYRYARENMFYVKGT